MNEVAAFLLRREKPAGRIEWFYTQSFCSTLVIFSILVIPVQDHFIGLVPNYFQIFSIILGTFSSLTALLLLWRASAAHDGGLALLGGAYAFTVPLIIANIVTLPGVLFPAGYFQTQAASYIWLFWHLGFGVGALPFAVRRSRVPIHWLIVTAIAFTLAGACIAIALFMPRLPALVGADGHFTPLSRGIDVGVLLLYSSEIALLLRRRKGLSALEIWVGVAIFTLAVDRLIFTELLALRRFTLGFYFARSLSILSSGVVLVALFADLARTVRRADAVDGYAAVTEHLPVLTLIVDADGECIFVNPAWETLTGQTPLNALGNGFRHNVYPDDLAKIMTVSDAAEDRRIRLFDHATQTYRRHLLRAVDLGRSDARYADLCMLVAIDIEDTVRAEAARRELDLRLQGILDVVPQIVWTADAKGWVDWCNPAWYEYTGLSSEESLGWAWQSVYHPDDFAAVMQTWPQALLSGQPFHNEYRLRNRDGTYQWFLTSAVAQRDEHGVVIRWFGSDTNIDAQKREAERSSRIARLLQEAFLPEHLPQISGVHLDAIYRPAESEARVGGDWYDVLALADGRLLLSCGDAAGHGLGAATLAGRYRQSIAVTGVEEPDPAGILARVNRIAMLQADGMATIAVAVFDPKTRLLRYALAGHPEPVLAFQNESAVTLSGGDLPVGIMSDAVWTTHEIELAESAFVIFYTDGLTEFARDAVAAEQSLLNAATAFAMADLPCDLAAKLAQAVLGNAPPQDDIAVLVLQCGGERVGIPSERHRLKHSWRFHSSDARTAHTTRQILSSFLLQYAAPEAVLFEAELIIGELIANTVEHAPGLVEIMIDWSGMKPLLTVRDTGPGFDAGPLPSIVEPLSEGGRGLFLIHALASEVVMRPAFGFGTEISCVLPIERRSVW